MTTNAAANESVSLCRRGKSNLCNSRHGRLWSHLGATSATRSEMGSESHEERNRKDEP